MPKVPKSLILALAFVATPSLKATAQCAIAGDGTDAISSALAAAAGMDMGRWNPVVDLAPGTAAPWHVTITATGRARCSDMKCWRLQALLDMQKPTTFWLSTGTGTRVAANPLNFTSRLTSRISEQKNCELRGGTSPTNCTAEAHKLTLTSSSRGSCSATWTFAATSTSGGALRNPDQLKNKLMWAGYPSSPNLAFSSTGTSITIRTPLDLVDDGTTPAAGAINACTRISKTNLAGRACTCGGTAGTFATSTWNASTFVCQP